jgi:magnesium-transporting ATPase (P-type)
VTHDTASRESAPASQERVPAWHALSPAEVELELDVDQASGLSVTEAAERLERYGPNELDHDEPRGNLEILIAQFTSPLIYILLVAFVVTIIIDEYTDAAVIAAVLVINATIGFFQERKADRSVHALMELAAPRTTVVRDGGEAEIDSAELVPGDVVLLTSGSRVPADLRLVSATTLDIDESLMTGESVPARKSIDPVAEDRLAADRACMAFMGSAVASGRGRGIVTSTGADTVLGGIAESIRTEEQPETPLQQRMRRFANIIAVAVLGSTLVAFFLGVAMGEPIPDMFLTAVALAVAVVPEGLPVAFTVAMALGVHRMAQRSALIRSLPAVETLGSTNVIGSDKTGTLTANRMTVLRGWSSAGWVTFTDEPSEATEDSDVEVAAQVEGDRQGPLAQALRTAIIANEAGLVDKEDGSVEHRGDPTESALLVAARTADIEPQLVRDQTEVLATVPFESELQYSYTITNEDGPVLRLKGAPERVLDLCTSILGEDGPCALDHEAALAAAHAMAERGLRVLAMAERRLDGTAATIDPMAPPSPEDLTLTAMVGMQDPPRPGVKDAIKRCRNAGIRVVMITGDHAATARAIAADLGISDSDGQVLTGSEVETISDDDLFDAVTYVDVFARVAPEHKLRVVHALRAHDQVVAVTGDGVNDGPALKAADIGVAMGRSGTDVAREASDMVLTDDNFVSIANAVEEGRVVFDNVRKVTYFLLSTGAAAIVAIIASIAAGMPLPYVPAALLWLNVVTNGMQDVALAFEPGEPDVLDRKPRRREDGIVNAVLWERTILTGTVMAAGSLWLFTWAMDVGLSDAQSRGAALTTLVVAMAAHVYNARSERRSIVRTHIAGNRFLLIATIVALTIHVAASYWGPTQHVLQIEPVTGDGWWRIGIVAIAVVLASEAHKWLRSRR